MKLKKEIVAEREQFVIDLFKTEPLLSIPKANKEVLTKFGSAMRLQRMYEIRKQVLKEFKRIVNEKR